MQQTGASPEAGTLPGEGRGGLPPPPKAEGMQASLGLEVLEGSGQAGQVGSSPGEKREMACISTYSSLCSCSFFSL